MTDLLLKRIEAAGPEDERDIIRDVLEDALHSGWITSAVHTVGWNWWYEAAYLNAVLLLLPEGAPWWLEYSSKGKFVCAAATIGTDEGPIEGLSSTPALALLAAGMKARDADE